ncbi:hypothetical protein [Halobacterium yunchengense]|uniref:hypothetical protein n=1 Tax=Halobacterium yunchengense TaxID=3108497 RepID=UPI003008E0B4
MTATAAGPDSESRWWVPIAALAATLPAMVVLSAVLPPDPVTSLPLFVVALAGVALALLSPVFVSFDRDYLAAAGEWTPSPWYYLMAALPVAPLVAAAYVYRRHQRVGVPDLSFGDGR